MIYVPGTYEKILLWPRGESSPHMGHCLYRVLCQAIHFSRVLTKMVKSLSLGISATSVEDLVACAERGVRSI